MFKVGDFVTRKKYGNDIVFKIVGFEGNKVFLKGVDLRLLADSDISDLVNINYNYSNYKHYLLWNLCEKKYSLIILFI